MKRIIIHWTAGNYFPTDFEKQCYHFLVDKNGKVYNGKFSPECNLKCEKGRYAAHTGGGNTGSIGISLCGMYGFVSKYNQGKFPLTSKQFEAAMEYCAKLTIKYDIPITPTTVMTHYEFGQKHPNTTSFGKIDITFIPSYPWVEKNDVGKFIRSKIKWYKAKLQGE